MFAWYWKGFITFLCSGKFLLLLYVRNHACVCCFASFESQVNCHNVVLSSANLLSFQRRSLPERFALPWLPYAGRYRFVNRLSFSDRSKKCGVICSMSRLAEHHVFNVTVDWALGILYRNALVFHAQVIFTCIWFTTIQQPLRAWWQLYSDCGLQTSRSSRYPWDQRRNSWLSKVHVHTDSVIHINQHNFQQSWQFSSHSKSVYCVYRYSEKKLWNDSESGCRGCLY